MFLRVSHMMKTDSAPFSWRQMVSKHPSTPVRQPLRRCVALGSLHSLPISLTRYSGETRNLARLVVIVMMGELIYRSLNQIRHETVVISNLRKLDLLL
jgi:hypothetical protein